MVGQREEEVPALKGLYHRAKHRDSQDPPNPEEIRPALQRSKEAEDRKWVPKKGPASEPGTNQGSRKPSREEIRKTPNRTGKEVEPEQRLKEKKVHEPLTRMEN